MTSFNELLILGALVGYPLTSRLSLKYIQPKRLQLAQIGKQILRHPDAEPKLKELVRSMLDDAYSSRVMIVMTAFVPLAGLVALFKKQTRMPVTQSAEVKGLLDEFVDLHILATSAANPLFAILVAIEMAALTLLLFPFGQGSRGRAVQFDALRRVEKPTRKVFAA